MVFIMLFAASTCDGQSTEKPTQWLVLENGQTIEGKITLIDHRYEIIASSGSRMLIPESQARFVADSMQDVYWDRWASVAPEDGPSQIELFQWCVRNDLLKEAQKQINLVAKLDDFPDQTQNLSRMAYELQLATERKMEAALAIARKEAELLNIRKLPALSSDPRSSLAKSGSFSAAPMIPTLDTSKRIPARRLAKAPPTETGTIDAEGNPVAAEASGEVIGLVGFEETATQLTRRNKPAYVPNAQLDRETRAMPKGTVQFFRQHIEPGLINSCYKCHDSHAMAMPLTKRSFGKSMPRRMTQQNMHFVAEWINKSDPLNSRLFQMATTAHGEQTVASFGSNELFAGNIKKWAVAISDDPARWLLELARQSQQPTQTPDLELEAAELAELDAAADIPEPNSPVTSARKVPKPKSNLTKPIGADPYDPAGFNEAGK